MLKIKIVALDRCVVMYILEQDESLRGMGDWTYGSVTFHSSCHPAIEKSTCYLRGTDISEDTRPCFARFDNNEARDKWLKHFREAFNAFEHYLNTSMEAPDTPKPDEEISCELFTISKTTS